MNWDTTGPRGHALDGAGRNGLGHHPPEGVRRDDSASAEVAIEVRIVVEVTSVDQPPEGVDDEARTPEDRPGVIDGPANDTHPDGDRLRVETVSAGPTGRRTAR